MSGMAKPVQLGATIVLGVLLIGAVAAGLIYGDDLHELWEGRDDTSSNERVQMQGVWLGMRLVPANTAAELGVPTAPKGVRVDEISERMGWRARQAGLMPGDIITSVNGKKIGSLTDVDSLSRSVKTSNAMPMEVLRYGQPLTLTLPAIPAVMAMQPPPAATPGPAPVQPAAIPYQPGPGAPNQGQPSYYCPLHRQSFAAGQVHPHYRCPMCYGPLNRAQ
ncbi:MAG: PDZ domain-containing protein [Deltaproteobacteria bacterium]|nr:PDZ domain-containing protein [Deltaproteobacteria bacterium]